MRATIEKLLPCDLEQISCRSKQTRGGRHPHTRNPDPYGSPIEPMDPQRPYREPLNPKPLNPDRSLTGHLKGTLLKHLYRHPCGIKTFQETEIGNRIRGTPRLKGLGFEKGFYQGFYAMKLLYKGVWALGDSAQGFRAV